MNFLWITRRRKFFLRQLRRKLLQRGPVHAPSSLASLVYAVVIRRITRPQHSSSRKLVSAAVHRFEESIAGRPYLIEVSAVAQDRWRAYIVRVPGVPTALMPFYGSTPVEAARLLSEWLTRAHARAAASI